MKKISLLLIAVVSATLLLPFPSGSKVKAQNKADNEEGPKWEYLALYIDAKRLATGSGPRTRNSEATRTINVQGEQGWELVAVNATSANESVFYFKKQK